MRGFKFVFLAVAALLCIVTPGFSAVYALAPTGKDTNAGTAAAPWATLQHAVTVLKAGDTAHVTKGTYVGVNCFGLAGGTAAAPITLSADAGTVIKTVSTTGTNASLADINIENSGVWVVQGFDVESDGTAQRACIRVANSGACQILNNVCNHGFIGIFVSGSSGFAISGNICSNSTDQHGIYVSINTNKYTVKGNICFGNNYDGIHLNCLIGQPNDGGLIAGNISYGNTLSGMDVEGISNAIFRNNIVYANQKHGITIHSQDQANTPATKGNTLVCNTIGANGMFGIQMQPADTAETIFDNIIFGGQGSYGAIGVSGTPAGLVSDYNISPDSYSVNLGVGKITLAQWQSQTGQDKHTIIGASASLFTNVTKNDYSLLATAPAIDGGVSALNGQSAPPVDFLNVSRPQGAAFDIGAYEFKSAGPPPTTTQPTPPTTQPDPATQIAQLQEQLASVQAQLTAMQAQLTAATLLLQEAQRGDINGDGVVNFSDLLILEQNYQK